MKGIVNLIYLSERFRTGLCGLKINNLLIDDKKIRLFS